MKKKKIALDKMRTHKFKQVGEKKKKNLLECEIRACHHSNPTRWNNHFR